MRTIDIRPTTDTAFINFLTPYKPIVCGIATYSDFLTRECPEGRWGITSFILDNYGAPLNDDWATPGTPVRYALSGRHDFSARSIPRMARPLEDEALWFQHEFGIWRDNQRFINMLRELQETKVVTFHSLHFQRNETLCGLRREEYFFLRYLLPHIDGITVFSNGVYQAVTEAFPEWAHKVFIVRHGTHLFPQISGTSRARAKAMLHDYLVNKTKLAPEMKERLSSQRVLLDPNKVVIGGTGFITPSKGTEAIYESRRILTQLYPHKDIAAVYIGFSRNVDGNAAANYANELKTKYSDAEDYLIETYLPDHMLPVALRAFDVYLYWPTDCTQSGIMAHALGAGATVACRDMEGVGETIKMAGGLSCTRFEQLISGVDKLILYPGQRDAMARSAVAYAEKYSWLKQAEQHYEVAELLCRSRAKPLALVPPLRLGNGKSNDAITDIAGNVFGQHH
jgi:hypothetical protein